MDRNVITDEVLSHVGPPSNSDSSQRTMMHALHQYSHPSRLICLLRLADNFTQFSQIRRRMVHVSCPDIWPQTCSIGFMSGLIVSPGDPFSSMMACDPSESACSDACSWFHHKWPGYSSGLDGLHPWPWVTISLSWLIAQPDSRFVFGVHEPRSLPSIWYMEDLSSSLKWRCSVSSGGMGWGWGYLWLHSRQPLFIHQSQRGGICGSTHDNVVYTLKLKGRISGSTHDNVVYTPKSKGGSLAPLPTTLSIHQSQRGGSLAPLTTTFSIHQSQREGGGSLAPFTTMLSIHQRHVAGRRDRYPAARNQLMTILAVMCLPKRWIICSLRRVE